MRSLRVLLVNPPYRARAGATLMEAVRGVEPHHGLCSLAAVLLREGHRVRILDAEAASLGVEATRAAVARADADVVGLSVVTAAMPVVTELCALLRSGGFRGRIALGGPHPSRFPVETARSVAADAVFSGEAEESFAAWLRTPDEPERVRGIAFRTRDGVHRTARAAPPDLDELPLPAYDLLPDLATRFRLSLLDAMRSPSGSAILGRGCPHHCRFCDRSVSGARVRRLRPGRALELLARLRRRHGLRHVFFHDEVFLRDPASDDELLDRIEGARLDLTWGCHLRVDRVPDERLLARMFRSGCRQVQLGIESGAQAILDRLGKGIAVAEVGPAVERLARSGIRVKGLYMVGCPGETAETVRATARQVRALPLASIAVHHFTPYPGTAIARDIGRRGAAETRELSAYTLAEPVFVPAGMSRRELGAAYLRILAAFYLRPAVLGRTLSGLRAAAVLDALRRVARIGGEPPPIDPWPAAIVAPPAEPLVGERAG